jgi:uncharacterized protein (TIGR02569 family)
MAYTTLNPDIASAFGCTGAKQKLAGGEGRSVRVGQCVLKPIDNPARYSWACELLLGISQEGFRLSVPRQTTDGSFVYKGWGASTFEPGQHVHGRWQERLNIARAFHSKVNENENSPMPPSDDWWSVAHEIAWQVAPLPSNLHPKTIKLVKEIFARYRPLARDRDIIHSDICGNIIFQEGLDPCIIDFSPAYGSVEYAEAILVADAIAWENAPMDIVNLLQYNELYRQNLLRAINFRAIVAALFRPKELDRFLAEYAGFKPIIDFVFHGGI